MYVSSFSGKSICPIDLKEDDICLLDIVQSLSLICRFNGQIPFSYTVLNHSLNCAALAGAQGLSDRMILASLIHDFPESISPTGDIVGPLKDKCVIFSYKENKMMPLREYENDVMDTIIHGLKIKSLVTMEDIESPKIKLIDKTICNSESLYIRGYQIWDDVPVVKNEFPYLFSKDKPENLRERFFRCYNLLT